MMPPPADPPKPTPIASDSLTWREFLAISLPIVVGSFAFGILLKFLGTPQPDKGDWYRLSLLIGVTILSMLVMIGLRFLTHPLLVKRPAQPSAPVPPRTPDELETFRSRFAHLVLGIGGFAILALSLVVAVTIGILAASNANGDLYKRSDTILMGLFASVLPILATWVGTVIAFYFTEQNYRTAAEIATKVSERTVEPLAVSKMVQYDKIAKLEIPYEYTSDGVKYKIDSASQIPMDAVINLFSPPVTRVMVFEKSSKKPIYIIRDKLVTQDIRAKGKVIQDYLNLSNENALDAVKFKFISDQDTVALAKRIMESHRVVDLFVTRNGQEGEAVLGWLSDDDVKKALSG